MKINKNIIVFYHKNCLDGFASSFVAYKKFKEKAQYIPLAHNDTGKDILKGEKIKISELKDKEVYFIDFCVNEEELKKIEKICKKLVVIDHHIGKKELVESLPNHHFRNGVSGGYLAHEYFFPKNKIPEFIKYVSIGDTYTFSKKKKEEIEEKEIISYLVTLSFDFKVFLKVEKDLEDKKKFVEFKTLGRILNENYLKLVDIQVDKARLIDFEGHKVYAINASSIFRNELGHRLSLKSKSKFALIYTIENGELKVSLRGEGKVDLSKLAEKYSGGGHFNASAFRSKDEKFIQEFIKKVIS